MAAWEVSLLNDGSFPHRSILQPLEACGEKEKASVVSDVTMKESLWSASFRSKVFTSLFLFSPDRSPKFV